MTPVEDTRCCLVLRLAGPLQSWGTESQFNRRDTANAPTKSGVIGLLAAAEGRRREDPIVDLLQLRLAVRVDQPGTLLRDYHTVSDYRGVPLLSAAVDGRGLQRRTSPAKHTAVTQRYYLQDAVFVAVVEGGKGLLEGLAEALDHPAFPLALGRRCCAPSQPVLVRTNDGEALWDRQLSACVAEVPWQASESYRQVLKRRSGAISEVALAVTSDDAEGDDSALDLPVSFRPGARAFTVRSVSHGWLRIATGFEPGSGDAPAGQHDPFVLLGW